MPACECRYATVALFRKKGVPTLWIQNKDEYDGAAPGLPGFEILDSHAVDAVIGTSSSAEHCVLSTCRGVNELDLTSVILSGGIASAAESSAGSVEKASGVISSGALRKVLE